jgi:hypothetical protein
MGYTESNGRNDYEWQTVKVVDETSVVSDSGTQKPLQELGKT